MTRASGRLDRCRPQGLSAAVGNVHRAGAARARAARVLAGALLAAPADRRARRIRCTPRSARRVTYLPEYLHDAPLRVCRAWRRAAAAGLRAARAACGATCGAIRRAAACAASARRWCSAAELPPDVVHLHAHFLHTPASVARYAAMLRGLALELLGAREGHLDDARMGKAREARGMRVDGDVHGVQRDAPARARRRRDGVDLVYHGIDTRAFRRPSHARAPPTARIRARRSRCSPSAAPSTRRASTTCCTRSRCCRANSTGGSLHIGGGPLLPMLERLGARARHRRSHPLARARRRTPRCSTPIAPPTSSCCRRASAHDGDRDGLPNVLLEAQSQRVACVSTRVSGIPELIVDGVTGLLVPPRAPGGLAAALSTADRRPGAARHAGRRRLRAHDDAVLACTRGADRLARRFAACLAAR